MCEKCPVESPYTEASVSLKVSLFCIKCTAEGKMPQRMSVKVETLHGMCSMEPYLECPACRWGIILSVNSVEINRPKRFLVDTTPPLRLEEPPPVPPADILARAVGLLESIDKRLESVIAGGETLNVTVMNDDLNVNVLRAPRDP